MTPTTTPTIHSDVQQRRISDGMTLKRITVGPKVYYQLQLMDNGDTMVHPVEANDLKLLRIAINDLVGVE